MGDKGMGGGKQPQKGGGFSGDKKQAGGKGAEPVKVNPGFKGGGSGKGGGKK